MAISEAQLETWSHQGPSSQFTDTYKSVKGVLESPNAPYANRSFEIFLQGSYGNDTNIYADSDVDIVIKTDSVFYSDTSQLSEQDKGEQQKGFSLAAYQLEDFKCDVVAWLMTKYPGAVTVGAKAVTIKGNASRRDADVIVCAELKKYRSYSSAFSQNYVSGICFFYLTARVSKISRSSIRQTARPSIKQPAPGLNVRCGHTRICATS